MQDHDKVAQLAKFILEDAILLRQLSDRVYAFMQEEVRNQQDRLGGTKRR